MKIDCPRAENSLYLRSIRSLYEHKNYGLLKTNPSGSFVGVFFDKSSPSTTTKPAHTSYCFGTKGLSRRSDGVSLSGFNVHFSINSAKYDKLITNHYYICRPAHVPRILCTIKRIRSIRTQKVRFGLHLDISLVKNPETNITLNLKTNPSGSSSTTTTSFIFHPNHRQT